jgi:hypothetical protein
VTLSPRFAQSISALFVEAWWLRAQFIVVALAKLSREALRERVQLLRS